MLNKQRFFRFGLDLQLEEVDRPKDMSLWAGRPGFVEENLATVLSLNLPTLLCDEEWLVIGRDDTNMAELGEMSVSEFNRYFGAVPRPSSRYIQSPGLWGVPKFHRAIVDDREFLKICRFKWAFNAKPDIVIHTSRDEAVCVEAKLESVESHYPQASREKDIF